METSRSPNNSWPSNAVWLILISTAAAAVGFSVIEVISSSVSFSRGWVVVSSLFISILLSRYAPRIPGTNIRFPLKDLFGFWGVIWLGISGGVLLTACASVASRGLSYPNRRRLAADAAVNILST